MSTIETAGALRPGSVNTPLDERSRVSTRAELMNIQLPYVGLIVYCEEDGQYYRITHLKSAQIGALTVADAAVASYELLTAAAELPRLNLVRPAIDEPCFLKLYVSPTGSSADLVLAVDTAIPEGRSRTRVYALYAGGGTWEELPVTGLSPEHAGAAVSVDLSNISGLPGYIFYRWETADNNDREFQSLFFPSLGSCTAQYSSPEDDGDDTTVNTKALACVCVSPPAAPFDGLLWVQGGSDTPVWVVAPNGFSVVNGECDPSQLPDFTIVLQGE